MDNQPVIINPQTPEPSSVPLASAPPRPLFAKDQPPVTVNKAKHSKKPLLFTLLAIILIAAAAYGGYYWEHTKVAKLNSDVSILNTKVIALTGQVANLQAAAKQSQGSSATVPNQNVIKIPALGVQITVPDGIKDLTVSAPSTSSSKGNGVTSVNISTQTISSAIPPCKANAFGSLSKTPGQYPTSGVSTATWHQQFSSFYLTLSPSVASCAPAPTSQTNQKLLAAQSAVFEASLPSIELIAQN
jgi:outer membrane murein-binding lipoprotein Lpp